ncbi:MAG: cytochrome c peroxidase [Bacteroidota bacterium]
MKKYLLLSSFCLSLLGIVLLGGTSGTLTDRLDSPLLPYWPSNYTFFTIPMHFEFDPDIPFLTYAPIDNGITNEGATLGRVLFYDTRLSLSRTVSCASCHVQEFGFADPAPVSSGQHGEKGIRNSIGLSNAGIPATGKFFWDSSADTMRNQILLAITSSIEMNLDTAILNERLRDTDFYAELFYRAFGDSTINTEQSMKAIGQFVRSMVSFQSKYDWERNWNIWGINFEDPFFSFTDQENLGKSLFHAHCQTCHTGELFITREPRNNGINLDNTEIGFAAVTSNEEDLGKFKAPSLRNIEFTAPYMHDGRLQTLEEVIAFYSTGIQANPNLDTFLVDSEGKPKQFNFTSEESEALIAFLKTLSDSVFLNDARWSDPFDPHVSTESVWDAGPFGFPWSIKDELSQTIEIKTYPNPAFNRLKISYDNPQAEERQIILRNLQGQSLWAERSRAENIEIVRQNWAAGVYVIEVIADGRRLGQSKIIFQ